MARGFAEIARETEMIPGIDVDSTTEARIWQSFEGWADHFMNQLRVAGMDGLIVEYRELVDSVETETCGHGPNGTRQTGAAWAECCGSSYEFRNDLGVRDALDHILQLASDAISADTRATIHALDKRLQAMYPPSVGHQGAWWRAALPVNIRP